jgi:glycerol-3-phosphate dehydrogenase
MMGEPALGATGRSRLLASLADEAFDVLVVGGGIGAACAAWDAALRGLKVALVERLDFGAATSAHSFKVLHGGIRYLQHMDLPRLRESCHERGTFLRIAPHLTQPLPIVIPTFGHGIQSRWVLAAAFLVLELLTLDRNRGLSDRARAVPSPFLMSRKEVLRRFPGLSALRPTGAGVFYDGQIRNPPRTVLAIVRAAAAAGAVVANYCEAEQLIVRGDQVLGAEVRDLIGGQRFAVRAAVTINATGPFAPWFLKRQSRPAPPKVPLSRDMAIVVRRRLDPKLALAVQTRYADPDAVLSRGNRHLFMAPWRDRYTLIGVNSRVYSDDAYKLTVTDAEIAGFVAEINEAYPGFGLTPADVSLVNAGLLPFGENEPESKDLSFGKRSVVVDHAEADGLKGLVTGMSIRWTMGRLLGKRVVDLAENQLRGRISTCLTDQRAVFGGDIESLTALEGDIRTKLPSLTPAQSSRLAIHYGGDWRNVLAGEEAATDVLDGTDTLRAEVRYAVRHELAATLNDVVMRRLELGSGEQPAAAALAACADLMAEELGWDDARRAAEIARVRASYPFAGPQTQYPVTVS